MCVMRKTAVLARPVCNSLTRAVCNRLARHVCNRWTRTVCNSLTSAVCKGVGEHPRRETRVMCVIYETKCAKVHKHIVHVYCCMIHLDQCWQKSEIVGWS
jgi:hypothetical protein